MADPINFTDPAEVRRALQRRLRKHATVQMAGFENPIPLIGVPPNATAEQCDKCKKLFHLSEVTLDAHGAPTCRDCLNVDPHPAPDTNQNTTMDTEHRIQQLEQEMHVAQEKLERQAEALQRLAVAVDRLTGATINGFRAIGVQPPKSAG